MFSLCLLIKWISLLQTICPFSRFTWWKAHPCTQKIKLCVIRETLISSDYQVSLLHGNTGKAVVEKPWTRDGGAWWAAVYGVTESRTRLKWLSSSSSSVAWALHGQDSRYSGCRERREKEFVRIRVHGQHREHARLGVLHLWASRWNSGWTG